MDVIEGSRFRRTLRLWLYLAAGDMPRVAIGGDMAELVEGWGGGCVDWRGGTIWSLLEGWSSLSATVRKWFTMCRKKPGLLFEHVHCDYVIQKWK